MVQFYLFCCAFIALLVAAAPLGAQTTPASRERPSLGTTIPVDALADLPASASVLSLLDAAQADLISDRLDTGGLTTADPSRMGAHGSTWTQTRLRLGPADITDPQGSGSPMLLPAVVAWDRVDVATGLMPVDVNAPGLAVTLQPRRPGDSWTRMIDGFMSRPGLLSRTTPTNPPAIARLHTWNDADLLLGGPISSGRAGLVLAADWTRSSRFERDNPTRLDAALASAFAHLELTPSPDDSVRSIVWVQRARSPFANRNAFSQPAAAEHKTAIHAQTMWE